MIQNLVLDNLKESSLKYKSFIPINSSDINFNTMQLFRKNLAPDIESVIITNYFQKKDNSIWYACRIDRENIELLDQQSLISNHFIYTFNTDILLHQSNEASTILKNAFKNKCIDYIKEIKASTSQLFDEII